MASTIDTDLSPSAVAVFFSIALDSIFRFLCVPQWRDYLPFAAGSRWLSHALPSTSLSEALPILTTYADFIEQNNGLNSYWNFSSMYMFAKMPSTSLGVVTTNDAIVVLLCLVFFMRRVKGLLIPYFCSVGRKLGRSTHGIDWERENDERIFKFGEYVFRFFFHSAVSVYGLWYFLDEPWWDPAQGGVKVTFAGHPDHAIDVGMIWYYLLQCAYNVEAMISLIELSVDVRLQGIYCSSDGILKLQSPIEIAWSPTYRGDFPEMFVHHVITNLLVIGSSHCRFTRIGSMVFMVHDISDVPVDLSKLSNFMKWKATTVVSFVALLATWVLTRLCILPFVIVKGVFDHDHEVKAFHKIHHVMGLAIFKLLLIGITTLHVCWFLILIRILYRLVMKGERHDLTEHKQGEEQCGGVTKNGHSVVAEEKKVI
jgi:hypothetical protein